MGQSSILGMGHWSEWGEAIKLLGQTYFSLFLEDLTSLSLINRWLCFLCRHPLLSLWWLKNYQLLTKAKTPPLILLPFFFFCLEFTASTLNIFTQHTYILLRIFNKHDTHWRTIKAYHLQRVYIYLYM